MWSPDDLAMAAGHSVDGVDPIRWQQTLTMCMAGLRPVCQDRTALAYAAGLLSSIERKNCWWLPEAAGDARPDATRAAAAYGVLGCRAGT